MPINGFDFPGIVFRQEFDNALTGTPRTLGVACIGKQYQLHNADGAYAAKINSTSYDSTTGLSSVSLATFKRYTDGVIDSLASTHHLVIKEGVWSYATVTTGITKYTSGSTTYDNIFLIDNPLTTNGRLVQAGDPIIVSGSSDVLTTVLKVEKVEGVIKLTVASGDLASDDIGSTINSIKFCVYQDARLNEVVGTGETSKVSINATAETVTIGGSITQKLTAFQGYSMVLPTGTLESGDFYIEFREAVNEYENVFGAINSLNDIKTLLGDPCADNPLALACELAFRGSNGGIVYFTTVKEDSPTAYETAIDFLNKYDQVYSIIPCTNDADIIKTCMGAVNSASENEESRVRRSLWYGIDLAAAPVLWEGSGTYTVDNTTATIELIGGSPFLDFPRKAGDKIKVFTVGGAIECSITDTDNVATATLSAVESNLTTGSTYSVQLIRTTPNAADKAASLIAQRKARTTSERGVCVWADGAIYKGELIPNFAVAAAAAGMRSYEPCHRPLSNLGYSFLGVEEKSSIGTGLLKTIGANGIWIVANNQDGLPVNKKQVTTAVSNNINKDEESIIANIDTVAMSVLETGKEYMGNSNISPALLDRLEDELNLRLESFTVNKSGSEFIGPQLLDYEITSIYQDTVNLDRVYASYSCTPPKPFNKFYVTMRVL